MVQRSPNGHRTDNERKTLAPFKDSKIPSTSVTIELELELELYLELELCVSIYIYLGEVLKCEQELIQSQSTNWLVACLAVHFIPSRLHLSVLNSM